MPTADQTPAFGGTFSVNQITSDSTGHVTAATSRTITIPSTLSNGTGTAGLIKTSSTVTSNSGYTACPVISGVPYYKDAETTIVTLTVDGWLNDSQTVIATGVTASNTVIVSPVPSAMSDYVGGGIVCTAQGANTLTFECDTTPTSAIDVNVVII